MDGTFFCSSKRYYKVFEILCEDKNANKIVLLIYVLTSHKSYNLYAYLFNNIKNLIINAIGEVELKILPLCLILKKLLEKKYQKFFLKVLFS